MRERQARPEIHTCVVGNRNHSVQTYCTFLVCFMSFFFFPFYVARASSLHIHSLPSVVRCYSHFFFFPTRMRSCICFLLLFSLFFLLVRICEHSIVLSSLLCDLIVELDVEKSLSFLSFSESIRKQRKKEDRMLA